MALGQCETPRVSSDSSYGKRPPSLPQARCHTPRTGVRAAPCHACSPALLAAYLLIPRGEMLRDGIFRAMFYAQCHVEKCGAYTASHPGIARGKRYACPARSPPAMPCLSGRCLGAARTRARHRGQKAARHIRCQPEEVYRGQEGDEERDGGSESVVVERWHVALSPPDQDCACRYAAERQRIARVQ